MNHVRKEGEGGGERAGAETAVKINRYKRYMKKNIEHTNNDESFFCGRRSFIKRRLLVHIHANKTPH